MIYGIKQDDLLDVKQKKDFLKVLDIPIYESPSFSLFGYKFHDVIIKLTRISVFIKFGSLKYLIYTLYFY